MKKNYELNAFFMLISAFVFCFLLSRPLASASYEVRMTSVVIIALTAVAFMIWQLLKPIRNEKNKTE